MMKKLLKISVITLTLGLTSTVALADHPVAGADRAPFYQEPAQVAFKRPQHAAITLDSQYALRRSGTLTLDVGRGARRADLALVASGGVGIRRVMIEYANGRTKMLRGGRDGTIDLPDGGRIVQVHVQYVNRGSRGAMVSLIAKDARPGRRGFQQR